MGLTCTCNNGESYNISTRPPETLQNLKNKCVGGTASYMFEKNYWIWQYSKVYCRSNYSKYRNQIYLYQNKKNDNNGNAKKKI